jgi:hypothetical protein
MTLSSLMFSIIAAVGYRYNELNCDLKDGGWVKNMKEK